VGAVGAVVAGAAEEARALAEAGVAESIFAEADATGATAGADTSARIDRGLSATIIAHDPNRKVRCVGQPDAPDLFSGRPGIKLRRRIRSTIASHPADAGISQQSSVTTRAILSRTTAWATRSDLVDRGVPNPKFAA
jgi:hypothetical protein